MLLDQPTIVGNGTGQRPVENIVGSSVGLRYGGMQPANTSKLDMFGPAAPVSRFLSTFGGAADPLAALSGTRVFETYPVLTMIALGWTLPDSRLTGRLPKYNPERKRTFSHADWRHVCQMAAAAFGQRGRAEGAQWLDRASLLASPRKKNQDGLDAYLCLLSALHFADGYECLMVGDGETGYIVVPHDVSLQSELEARCRTTRRTPSDWIRAVRAAVA